MTRAAKYKRKVAPEFLAVSLTRAKEHLKSEGIDVEDDLITAYIEAATEWAQDYAQKAFMKQVYEVFLNNWPHHSCVELAQYNPVQSVELVEYKTAEGTYTELSTSNYITDLNGPVAKVHFINNLPSLQSNQVDRVRITVTCGYSSSAEESVQREELDKRAVSAILLKVAEMHLYREDRQQKNGNLTAAEYLLHPLRSSIT